MAVISNKTFYIDPKAPTMGNGLTPESPFNRVSPYAVSGGWWPGFGGGNDYQNCKFLIKTGTVVNTRNPYGTSNDFSALRWELGSTDAAKPVLISYYGTGILPTVNADPNMPKFIGNADSTAGGVASTAVTSGIFVNAINVIVDHMDVSNMRGKMIINNSATPQNHSGVVVKNCNLHDSMFSEGTHESGVYLYGSNAKSLNNKFKDIGVDGIWMSGANAEAGFNHMERVGMFIDPISGDGQGDGIQFSGYSSNFYAHDNYIDHTTSDSKHCIIGSTFNAGVTGGLAVRNTIKAFKMATVNVGMYFAGSDIVGIGNNISGGYHSLVLNTETNTPTAFNFFGAGNLFTDARYNNIEIRNDGAKTAMTGIEFHYNTLQRSNSENGYNYKKAMGSDVIDTASPVIFNYNICINTGSPGSNYNLISERDTLGHNVYYGTSGRIYSYRAAAQITPSAGSLTSNPNLDADFNLTSLSPAALIGTGTKFWGGKLPKAGLDQMQSVCDAYHRPFPSEYLDWGGVQSDLHEKHPKQILDYFQ
jgi:hypothetical protein